MHPLSRGSLRVWTRGLAPRIALALVGIGACTGDPGATSTSAADTAEADASPTTTATATDATDATDATASASSDATSDGDACGPPPATPRCTPDVADDPRAVICAARTQAACEGPIEPGSGDACRWVDTQRFAAGATTCEAPTASGACVALAYFGDGCSGRERTCGDDTEGRVYARTTAACETEVFRGAYCGYNVLDWHICAFDTAATGACPQPWPTSGPASCVCAC